MSSSDYVEKLLERTRAARENAGYDLPSELADELKIPRVNYAKYETRTPLPHKYLLEFCKKTHVDVEYFLSGQPTKNTKEATYPEDIIDIAGRIDYLPFILKLQCLEFITSMEFIASTCPNIRTKKIVDSYKNEFKFYKVLEQDLQKRKKKAGKKKKLKDPHINPDADAYF